MDTKEIQQDNGLEIDVARLLKVLLNNIWIIIIAAVIVGAAAFCYAAFMITPMYSSRIMLYVNNQNFSISGKDISLSDLNASQSLVSTYTVLLKNKTTLDMVAEKAGVDYSYKELDTMIAASDVNDTEVMQVTVTCSDPMRAKDIANSIAVVLPMRVAEIIDGSSMKVVDPAIATGEKVSPSITKYTAIGIVLGAVIAAGIIVLLDVFDTTIHSEDYLISTYTYPVLAVIPDLNEHSAGKYSRYKYYGGG